MLVVPVVFMEFMTVMLPAGVLPQLEYEYFGSRAVLVGGLVRYASWPTCSTLARRSCYKRTRHHRMKGHGHDFTAAQWAAKLIELADNQPILPCSGVAAFLSFFTQPIIGAVSDRMGRKWLLLCTSTATALPHAILTFHNNLYVCWKP